MEERTDLVEYSRNRKIYIYGAGKIGKQCEDLLRQNHINPAGFLVTAKNQENEKDTEIIDIDSLIVEDGIGIIIAGSIANSIEMHAELVKRGFKDYVFYNDEIGSRVRGVTSFLDSHYDDMVAVYGSGFITRAVLDRVSSKDRFIVIDEDNEDTDLEDEISISNKIEDAGINTVIISDTVDNTSDIFVKKCDKAERAGVKLYDSHGNLLSPKRFVDKKLEAAKQSGRCALVIDGNIPRFDMNAGARLSYYYMNCLKNIGYSVWLLLQDSTSNGYEGKLEEEGIHVVKDEEYVKSWLFINGSLFDLVFLQRPECAEFFGDILFRTCDTAKIIYHPADLRYIRLLRQYELTGDSALKMLAEHDKEIEYTTIRNSDFTYVVGSKEKEIVEKLVPEAIVRDIPIYLYDENSIPARKSASERHDMIFVGGFGHNPNIDAVEWLAEEIMPIILDSIPDIVCRVVGGNAPNHLFEYASDNLIFEGYVADEKLKELYEGSRLAIAPLRFGAGIKGKIIEAAYYGLPVVTTFIGAEGIHEPEKFIVTEDTAKGFADAIICLYSDYDRINRIAEDTKTVIRDNYTSKIAESILRSDLGV